MRFRWHASAVAADEAGTPHLPTRPAEAPVVLASRPAAVALQQALGAPAFRIGGDGPPPEGADVFETLTGGSSGTPERIRRSQQSWIASFAVNAGLFGIGPGIRVAVLGDLVHSLALYAATEALHLGAEAHLLAGLRPDRQARALAARRIDLLYATPAQVQGLLAAAVPWPDLRRIVIGGARLTPALRAAIGRQTGAAVTEFYGAAETSFVTLADASTPEGSVGRPYPGVEIRIDDEGLVWVRSAYLAQHVASRSGDKPGAAIWRDGWVAPGECGQIEAGKLWLSGRIGRRVKVADQTVHPEVIETALLRQPGVRAGVVIAVRDRRRGHVLEACLVGDPQHEPAILAALRAEFGPLMAPRRLHWRAELPALPSGKPDLAQLQRDHDGGADA